MTDEETLREFLQTCEHANACAVSLALDDGCGTDFLDNRALHLHITEGDESVLREALAEVNRELSWRGTMWDVRLTFDTPPWGGSVTVYEHDHGITLKPLRNRLARRERMV